MVRKALFLLGFLASLMVSSVAFAGLWVADKEWNANWEAKYSEWVKSDFGEDFFTKGKWAGMSTDCADAVYFSRVVFAYENKLPFVIKDPTGGSKRITHEMSRFDSEKDEVKRLRRFMNWLADMVSTKTLPSDSYPVAINRTNIRPGTIWSRPRVTENNIWKRIIGMEVNEDPGHAELVTNVTETGVVELIGSTVPRAVRPLIPTTSLVFMPVETSTGFRNWKMPQDYAVSSSTLPGYSLEQFKMGQPVIHPGSEDFSYQSRERNLESWTAAVKERLALRKEERQEALKRMAQNICNLSHARLDAVVKATSYKARNPYCMDKHAYDAYSTPSRDKRIKKSLEEFVDASSAFGFTYAGRLKDLKFYFAKCAPLKISDSQALSVHDFAMNVLREKVSSDPNDPVLARWGLAEAPKTGCEKY